MGKFFRHAVQYGLMSGVLLHTSQAFARKSTQPVYEEPFDLAAGGAGLTRASQEGILFTNPAQLPFGGKFFRWFGSQFAVNTARESIDFAKTAIGGGGGDSAEEGAQSSDQAGEILDHLMKKKTPIHFGVSTATSFITSHFGIGAFARLEPDIYGQQFGSAGVPSVVVSAEAYAGAVGSVATTITRWLSLGITAKYLYVAEPDLELALTDEQRITELTTDPSALQDAASFGSGVGTDLGMLMFFQGRHVDYRLALKVDDVGDTQFTGTQPAFKQTIHVGTGLTLHGTTNALHLSLDYRDVTNVYEEKPFKRIHAGAKLLLFNYLGLAAGYYQGIPSVGVRLNLYLMQLGATAYGREMGTTTESRQRNLYVAYFGVGI